ncbi:hypothetical protein ACGFMM_31620 [Streptomyces sp. NPDC048604]|uniref:hypothetical protein n=1 Tax=Streptomyces sp. NPDC048604 TaxID=3365578 RepID=UPI0037215E8D
MDVDAVIDELYGLKPAEFTAARDAYVAQAREAEDAAGAKRIAGLRRPTLAAWASNLLVRTRPAEAEQLLRLGQGLREAHRTLDPEQLRQLSAQQHRLVAGLVRDAASLAGEAGQAVRGGALDELGRILRSVLADPDVAEEWIAGRLVKAPEATVGFTAALSPEQVPERPPPPAAAEDPRLRRARAALDEAREEARRLDAEVHAARSRRDKADDLATTAAEHVTALEAGLRAARDAARQARTEATHATDALRDAERSAQAARRTAERAERELKKRDPRR